MIDKDGKEVNNKSALAAPIAKCSLCGRVSNDPDSIGKRCNSLENLAISCPGIFSSILYPENWHECDICGGTGRIDDIHCKSCAGSGWISS
jgi:DnaJ-class molecular chaperone